MGFLAPVLRPLGQVPNVTMRPSQMAATLVSLPGFDWRTLPRTTADGKSATVDPPIATVLAGPTAAR